MSISSVPVKEQKPSDLRVSMECATEECATSLRLIAEYAANYPTPDASTLAKRIENVASLVTRLMNTRHPFRPGRVTSLVEQKYNDISFALIALADDVRERNYSAAARTVGKLHQIVTSVTLLLQVEAN